MKRWFAVGIGCISVACVGSMFLAVLFTSMMFVSDVVARDTYARRADTRSNYPVASTTVDMKNNRFVPEHISVQPGDTITWTNSDNQQHNVVFKNGVQSDLIKKGETFQTTLDTLGVFDYVCTLHGGMVGKVTVETASPGDRPPSDVTPAPAE